MASKSNPLSGLLSQLISSSSIGVDIGYESIIITVIKMKGGEPMIDELIYVDTPPGAISEGIITDPLLLGSTIKSALQSHGIKNNRITLAVSGQSAIIRLIKLPKMDIKELQSVMNEEAERYIPFNPEDIQMDYQVVDNELPPEEDGIPKMDVILVASQKELINSYIQMAEASKLELSAIDVASFACIRAFEHTNLANRDDESVAVVLVRSEVTDVNIIKDGVPKFSRSIMIGDTRFIENIVTYMNVDYQNAKELRNNLVIPPAGTAAGTTSNDLAFNAVNPTLLELATEVQRSIDFYAMQTGTKVDRIVLTGVGATIGNIAEFISAKVGIPIELGSPIGFVKVNDDKYAVEEIEKIAPLLSTSIGLAIRGVAR